MIYQIEHTTIYQYQDRATTCHNIVYQKPLSNSFQKLLSHEYRIVPQPELLEERVDFFGNSYAYFSMETPHSELKVSSLSEVEILDVPWKTIEPAMTPPWEAVVKILQSTETLNDVRQFYLDSVLVYQIAGLKEYILKSFFPGRPIIEAMLEFNTRIYRDFEYKAGYTDISTPLESLLAEKKGVCQDFAHFTLACLRSIGLAGKYVSGYIETIPPPGKKKLKGADASHAWIAIYVPDIGWIEFDPTNNIMVNNQHIRVAFGRDFKDVVPLKGIVYSSGGHKLKVSVDVKSRQDN
ncbi:MAG: transglutaminase family protein [Saprospiraceae bacterium]|nr:transglutaminase family protein [Saprospiraceae bacterium]